MFCFVFLFKVVNIFLVVVYFLSYVNDLKIFLSEYRIVYFSYFFFVDFYVEAFFIYKMFVRDVIIFLGLKYVYIFIIFSIYF